MRHRLRVPEECRKSYSVNSRAVHCAGCLRSAQPTCPLHRAEPHLPLPPTSIRNAHPLTDHRIERAAPKAGSRFLRFRRGNSLLLVTPGPFLLSSRRPGVRSSLESPTRPRPSSSGQAVPRQPSRLPFAAAAVNFSGEDRHRATPRTTSDRRPGSPASRRSGRHPSAGPRCPGACLRARRCRRGAHAHSNYARSERVFLRVQSTTGERGACLDPAWQQGIDVNAF